MSLRPQAASQVVSNRGREFGMNYSSDRLVFRLMRCAPVALALTLVALGAASSAAATTWSDPVTISSTGYAPQVVVAPNGDVTAVWVNTVEGAGLIVQASTKPAGSSTFGPTVDLTNLVPDVTAPSATVAGDGSVTVAWMVFDESSTIVQAATKPGGRPAFGLPQNVSLPAKKAVYGLPPSAPAVAASGDGSVTVAWAQYNGLGYVVQAATRLAHKSGFAPPVNLSLTGLALEDPSYQAPSVAMTPGGATTVVWLRPFGSSSDAIWQIQAASRPRAVAPFGGPETIGETAPIDSGPRVAMEPGGTTTAVWGQATSGLDMKIVGSTRLTGTTAFSSQLSSLSSSGAGEPQIVAGADGTFMVAWIQAINGHDVVEVATKAPVDNEFGTATPLSDTGSDAYGSPQIAIGPDGSATVAWEQFADPPYNTRTGIQAATRAAGESEFGSPVALTEEATSGDSAAYPDVAIGWDGSANVIWQEAGSANGIRIASTASTVAVSQPTVTVTGTSAYLTSRVHVKGPGKISQEATTSQTTGAVAASRARAKTLCQATREAPRAGTYSVKCNLGNEGRTILRKRALNLKIKTRFTPRRGIPQTKTSRLTISRR